MESSGLQINDKDIVWDFIIENLEVHYRSGMTHSKDGNTIAFFVGDSIVSVTNRKSHLIVKSSYCLAACSVADFLMEEDDMEHFVGLELVEFNEKETEFLVRYYQKLQTNKTIQL